MYDDYLYMYSWIMWHEGKYSYQYDLIQCMHHGPGLSLLSFKDILLCCQR